MKRQDYIKATQAAIINQPKYWAKHHNDRVLADGGTVTDKTPEEQRSYLTDYYKFLRETRLIDNLVFSWDGSAGIKTRTSGVNQYAAKLHDMSTGNRDAAQTTEANQPHIGGTIAPSEISKLKGLIGETGIKGLTGSNIQVASSGKFTISIMLKWNAPSTSSRIYLSSTNYIELTPTSITLRGDSGIIMTCPYNFKAGINEIITFEYNNGEGLILVNKLPQDTNVSSGAITFGSLFLDQTLYNFDGEINTLFIFDSYFSKSDIDTIPLPSTVIDNSEMQVQLFGQSAQNLVVNGDFRNGTTGWIANAGTIAVAAGVLTGTVTSRRVEMLRHLSISPNTTDKYYFKFSYKVPINSLSRTIGVFFSSMYDLTPIITPTLDWSTHSQVNTFVNVTNRFDFIFGVDGYPAAGETFSIKDVMFINLTATFGAGNEPTKEQCDLLFANYFEGSGNVLGTGRIRSVNSAGLLPSYLYFNGGQLRSNGLIKDEIRKGTNGYELVKRVGVGTLGAELITNAADREFSSDTGWWTKGLGTIADGKYSIDVAGNETLFDRMLRRVSTSFLTVGVSYLVSFDVVIESGFVLFSTYFGNSFEIENPNTTYSTSGRYYTHIRQASGGNLSIGWSFNGKASIDNISVKPILVEDGELNNVIVTDRGSKVYWNLATPTITPISHAGLLNSNSNGTVYFEPIIADAGVYSSNLAIQLTDYPIASFESIRKYANGTYTELNPATAVIAGNGLSFTHPDLVSGDNVEFTYYYNIESISRKVNLTWYEDNIKVPKIEGIAIGNQHWATSNYEGVVTGNGTVIPEVQDDAAWAALTTPAWCYYNNDPLNGAVYGKLYNWYAVKAIADNPPQGWRVPTFADYTQLINYLGGAAVAGGKMKKEGLTYWNTPNAGATNQSGFSLIGGGRRTVDGIFGLIGQNGILGAASFIYSAYYTAGSFDPILTYNSTTIANYGTYFRLIRNEPVGATERSIETGYITNALGVTNLDISIPFGYQVESVSIDSETNITGLSAKLRTSAGVDLETLFSAQTVSAGVSKTITVATPQTIQQTDPTVRINGTKSDVNAVFTVSIYLTKVVFS